MKRGDPLSLRECQIVERVAQGKSLVKIGMELKLATSTVGVHLMRARQKLGVDTTPELTAKVGALGMTKLVSSASSKPGPKLIGSRDDDNS